MLYQLSHFRSMTDQGGGAEGQIRTGDTAIFSRVLYQLSYLGPVPYAASICSHTPSRRQTALIRSTGSMAPSAVVPHRGHHRHWSVTGLLIACDMRCQCLGIELPVPN